jgi:hypothetical protein
VEPDGSHACIVTTGGDDAERIALYVAMVAADFEVLDPPEVARAVRTLGQRLLAIR